MKRPARWVLLVTLFFVSILVVSRVLASVASGVLFLSYFDNSTTNERDSSSGTAANISYTTGRYNQGVSFTTGTTLSYSSSGNINYQKGTIEFWLKPSWSGNDGGYYFLFMGNATDSTDDHSIQIVKETSNYVTFIIIGVGGGVQVPSGPAATDTSSWEANSLHHIAVSWDTTLDSGKYIKIYIDGELKEARTDLDRFSQYYPAQSQPNIYVGSYSDGTVSASGVIDDLIIFDSPLSDPQIASHFASQPYPPAAATGTPTPTTAATATSTPTPTTTAAPTATPTSSPTPTPTPIPLPPEVNLSAFDPNPTNNPQPEIKGTIKHFTGLSSIEYSLDEGATWFETDLALPTKSGEMEFVIVPETTLEDGNFKIKVRVKDSYGNETISDPQLLIVDLLPPRVGANTALVGPQTLLPASDGTVTTTIGAPVTFVASAVGGPSLVQFRLANEIYPFKKIEGTNLWKGELKLGQPGNYSLEVKAVDGAGNATDRVLNNVVVLPQGSVQDEEGNLASKAKVSLYVFEPAEEKWVLWDGVAFGQENPARSGRGEYSFLVPAGKYYLQASAKGFREAVSEVFTVEEATVINSDLVLTPRPSISLFGLTFSLPWFLDFGEVKQEIRIVGVGQTPSEPTEQKWQPVENFEFTTAEGEKVEFNRFLGKNLVLTFLTTWSPASQEQIPVLERLSRKKNLSVLPIFLLESQGQVKAFLDRGEYSLLSGVDKEGNLLNKFSVTTVPQHFLIDGSGVIRKIIVGTLTEEELIEEIERFP